MTTKFIHKSVLLLPALKRDQVNTALERHGYGPDNFSIEMTNPGGQTTHYASSIVMDDVMLAIVRQAMQGRGGEEFPNKRLSEVEAQRGLKRKNR